MCSTVDPGISKYATSTLKRAIDLTGAVIGLLLLGPVLLLIGVLVVLDDRGSAFFRQERVGHGGVPFRIHKFRTMVVGAEKAGAQITVGADRRITRIGRWLRLTKLDELPQLIDVLLGKMSLVGPRPEVPYYVGLYTAAEREVLQLRPGITDAASIRYRDEGEVLARSPDPEMEYLQHVMHEKIELSIDYARHASIWSDLGVIARTFVRLVR